jgi:hypothetical protein
MKKHGRDLSVGSMGAQQFVYSDRSVESGHLRSAGCAQNKKQWRKRNKRQLYEKPR